MVTLLCAGTFNTTNTEDTAEDTNCETGIAATFANDDDTDIGTVTIALGTTRPDSNQFGFVVLRGVRADVSGLSAGNKIVAAINSSTAPTGFVPIGQDRTESVGGTVSTVMDGLDVKVGQASRLLCNLGEVGEGDDRKFPVGGVPSITVSEGVPMAWETAMGGTMIAIKMNTLPEGVNLRWPHVVNFRQDPADDSAEDADETIWSTLTLDGCIACEPPEIVDDPDNPTYGGGGRRTSPKARMSLPTTARWSPTCTAITTAGTTGESDKDVTTEMDSFKIEFMVDVADLEKVGAGGISDIWAWLAPAGKTGDEDDRDTILSYVMMIDTDPDVVMGDIINFGECVTYLLFPYVTCSGTDEEGALEDYWTSALAIANTTMDDGVFGLNDGCGGPVAEDIVQFIPFPQSALMTADGMMMEMPDSMTVADRPGCRRYLVRHLQQLSRPDLQWVYHRQGRLPSCPWSGLCPGYVRRRRYLRFGPRLYGSGDSRSGIRQQRKRSVEWRKPGTVTRPSMPSSRVAARVATLFLRVFRMG